MNSTLGSVVPLAMFVLVFGGGGGCGDSQWSWWWLGGGGAGSPAVCFPITWAMYGPPLHSIGQHQRLPPNNLAHRHHLLRQKIKIHPITQPSLKQCLVIFGRELCVRENKTSKSLFDPKKWSVGGCLYLWTSFKGICFFPKIVRVAMLGKMQMR